MQTRPEGLDELAPADESRMPTTLSAPPDDAPSDTSSCLPVDEDGFFSLRFESTGGLGAHLASQILAEAGVLELGFNGSQFSSYGSEKKGSPVRSHIRFCAPEREIRTSTAPEVAQVVAVFHESLATPQAATGIAADGTLIVNSGRSPHEIRALTAAGCATVATVDALGIAIDERTRPNTAMLGAVVRSCPFIDPGAVREVLRRRLEHRNAGLVESNLRTFDRGYQELRQETCAQGERSRRPATAPASPAHGYLEAPIGGVILEPGNSIARDLSGSRQGSIPAFNEERCVHCGLCDLVCPDFCLVWEERSEEGRTAVRLLGIDYRFCKGCLKCTEACPTGALVEQREEKRYVEASTVPLFPWLQTQSRPTPAEVSR
jgi:pyruvate ferredoxin oxidoreductase gamma subunit